MEKFDYLIVGSGLFGSTCANLLKNNGKKVLVIDKRNNVAGNVYTQEIEGIQVHKYGAHIFHTDYKDVWNYVNSFVEFNRYTNSPVARYKDEIYNMPFNMNTFSKIWNDVITPEDALKHINEEKKEMEGKNISNLEEQAISLVGRTIYEKLIKGYTEKQWNRNCKELPAFIIKRLPVRLIYDNNYFNDKYQGIPIGGYTKLVEKMLEGIEVRLNTNYFDNRKEWNEIAEKVIYTGMLDEYFEYKLGRLEYRSLKFDTKIIEKENYQGNAVVNYTGKEVAYTRVIEHKHFDTTQSSKKTVITYEYPDDWTPEKEAYYVINDEKNNELAEKYRALANKEKNVIFGGRLASYKYYDMDDVIKEAMNIVSNELK
jgi:UDP-galactopyranose mutase